MCTRVFRAAVIAVLALGLAAVHVDAFSGGGAVHLGCAALRGAQLQGRSPLRGVPSGAPLTMQVRDGGVDSIGRRSILAGLAVLPLVPASRAALADEGAAVAAVVDPEEVVVEGEMRLEEGTDKKFDKLGGKGTVVVTLRVVGKGIIAEKKFNVEAGDFPPAGKPAKGKEVGGGVPFVIKAKELREKTEKGRTVTKEGLWGDDDIFVRVDLLQQGGNKKIASGLGKAKYLFDTQKHQTSFVLLE